MLMCTWQPRLRGLPQGIKAVSRLHLARCQTPAEVRELVADHVEKLVDLRHLGSMRFDPLATSKCFGCNVSEAVCEPKQPLRFKESRLHAQFRSVSVFPKTACTCISLSCLSCHAAGILRFGTATGFSASSG